MTGTSDSIVRTKAGSLRGTLTEPIHVFKGIPFAAPPVGKNRWAPPQPCPAWEETRDALEIGPVCPQNEMSGEDVRDGMDISEIRDEDCLSLNIWTPGLDSQKRPVMVWIHGGAFIIGAGSQPPFDSTKLANAGNVVVVTINYRLGAFGFINLKQITGGKIPATGNEGLLDQIAALDWVAENITGFGGDPDNITVFGESAGGMSIGCLLGLPAASGKFKKAIIQSGTANTVASVDQATSDATRFLELLGIPPNEAEKLYDLSPSALLEAQEKLCGEIMVEDGRITPFHPVVDGDTMPELPIHAIAEGAAADVTVMAGSNLDEFGLFNVMNPRLRRITDAEALAILDMHLPPEQTRDIYEVYRSGRQERGEAVNPYSILTAVETDLMFGWSKVRLLEAQSKHNPQTFDYLFDWKSPALPGYLGACHSLEIGFVFGNLEDAFHGKGPEADALSEKMQSAWIAFAHSGVPSHAGLGNWPPYGDTRSTMRLGKSCYIENDPFKREREVWEKYGIVMTKPI